MKFLLSSFALLVLGTSIAVPAVAADAETSAFGQVAIPSPEKPANATDCVEPVEVMRRDHMKFLLHQRDATVLEGDRSKQYSLVGCIDCHNPASTDEKVVRYEDPQHFCADCHNYASVKIDCFECHADRGLSQSQQSHMSWQSETDRLSAYSFSHKTGESLVD